MSDLAFCGETQDELALFLSLDTESVSDACLPDPPTSPVSTASPVRKRARPESPEAEAFAFCVRHGLGVRTLPDPESIEIIDFPLFYACWTLMWEKQRPPAEDMRLRVAVLRRWLPELPDITTLAPRAPFVTMLVHERPAKRTKT